MNHLDAVQGFSVSELGMSYNGTLKLIPCKWIPRRLLELEVLLSQSIEHQPRMTQQLSHELTSGWFFVQFFAKLLGQQLQSLYKWQTPQRDRQQHIAPGVAHQRRHVALKHRCPHEDYRAVACLEEGLVLGSHEVGY